MKNIKSGIALSALAALLNGCGGGGDTGGGGLTAAAASSDPIDKYLGTIVTTCSANSWITDPATGATLHERGTMTSQSKVSATKALFQFKHDIYATSDCSGAPRASLTVSGADTWFNVDGSATIGGTAADKVTVSEGVKLSGISGTNVTVNGVTYNAKYLAQRTDKDIIAFVGNDLYFGDFSKALDAQGYPTALQSQFGARKQ